MHPTAMLKEFATIELTYLIVYNSLSSNNMVNVLNIKRDTFDHAIPFNHNKCTILFNHLEGIAITLYGYPQNSWVILEALTGVIVRFG